MGGLLPLSLHVHTENGLLGLNTRLRPSLYEPGNPFLKVDAVNVDQDTKLLQDCNYLPSDQITSQSHTFRFSFQDP